MIYAYGIADPAPGLPPTVGGIGSAELHVLEAGGLAVIYSRHRDGPLRPSPELVMEHERVLEAVAAHTAVLPLRFGTRLEAPEQLAEAVTARRRELADTLDRVRGRVELGVRVLSPGSPASPQDATPATRATPASRPTGRDYLLSVAEAHRRNERVADDIHRPLQALAAGSVRRERSVSPALMAAAYLVDVGEVDRFRDRAREVAAIRPDVEVLVTGPWPPYSFVGGDTV